MRKVIGAIDGCHIPIKAPRQNQDVYINRKGFHSIVLQAICNHKLVFTDCFVGWPGSTHDARVLRRSDIYTRLTEGRETMLYDNSYIIGDSAYPLKRWLMTPFRDNGRLSSKQKNYNFLHSSTRMVIEKSFALLKGRFRRLKYVDIDLIADVSDLVMACCTLHNVCLATDEEIEDMIDEGRDEECQHHAGYEDPVDHGETRSDGVVKRNEIMEYLWANV